MPQVWQDQADPDEAFDAAHDVAEGGAISCATGTTPSAYAAALRAIAAAARRSDRTALLAQASAPLLYIDASGERQQVGQAQLAAAAQEVFAADVLALLGTLELADMTVEPGSGGFFALGAVWLAPAEPGALPQIVTINRQALAEAAAAAKR